MQGMGCGSGVMGAATGVWRYDWPFFARTVGSVESRAVAKVGAAWHQSACAHGGGLRGSERGQRGRTFLWLKNGGREDAVK